MPIRNNDVVRYKRDALTGGVELVSGGDDIMEQLGVNTIDAGAPFALLQSKLSQSEKTFHIGGTYDLGGGTLVVGINVTIFGGSLQNGTVQLSSGSSVSGVTFVNAVIKPVGDGITICNNTIKDLSGDNDAAICIYDSCKNLRITNNHIHGINGASDFTSYCSGIKVNPASNEYVDGLVIEGNDIHDYVGPAGIFLYGDAIKVRNFAISKNRIHHSRNFGIEILLSGDIDVSGRIDGNEVFSIGAIRETSVASGTGCGGIYTNVNLRNVIVTNNYVQEVLEIGIEGQYKEVSGNTVVESGFSQRLFPVADNAGIYGKSSIVKGNTIVNCGSYGGYGVFDGGVVDGVTFVDNVVISNYHSWASGTLYAVGDDVVSSGGVYRCTSAGVSGATPPSGSGAAISDGAVTWDFRKTKCNMGVNINAISGMQNSTFLNNRFIGIGEPFSFSGINSGVDVSGNTCSTEGSVSLIGGYGARCAKGFRVSSAISENLIVNSKFSNFAGAVPDGWSVLNGTVSKVQSSIGARMVPQVTQSDGAHRSRLIQTISTNGKALFFDFSFVSNDGLLVNLFNGQSGAYLGEFSIAETSQHLVSAGGYFDGAGVDSVKIEVSTKTLAPLASGLYFTLSSFSCYEI